ncbi:hypothetical protein ES702_04736 [subsurface metagenome]
MLFGEYLADEMLLRLSHKFITISLPKTLRIFLKNDKKLFSDKNLKVFDACDFIAAIVSHIPPPRLHLIRYYGLYASRSKGKWAENDHIVRLAPEGWKKKLSQNYLGKDNETKPQEIPDRLQRSAWARLIKKVYGIDPGRALSGC